MRDSEVEALRNRVWRSLPPVTAALTGLYMVFTVSHALLLPAAIKPLMMSMAGCTALALLCTTIAVRRVSALRRFTYPIAFFVMALLSTNSVAHVYLTQDIAQTTNVMLVILGAGFVLLSGFWYYLALAMTLGFWILVGSGLAVQSLYLHFAFALFSATVASIVFRLVHVRDLVENHRLRMYSERQRAEMEHLATHDVLTGLANRRKFLERLKLEVARAKRAGHKVAVLYIDLNDFKRMNDTHGHEYGDEVLKVVGRALSNLTRETDQASRLGGDEFAVLLTDLKEGRAASLVAEKILRHFQQAEVISGNSTLISLSIGQAVLPDETEALDELLRMADQRMYAHKGALKAEATDSRHA